MTLRVRSIWKQGKQLPEAGVSSSLLFAPFGQAVHLQTTHPGIFFGGKYDFIDMLRSQILSLIEPIYS